MFCLTVLERKAMNSRNPSQSGNSEIALAVMRVVVGLLFLILAEYKLTSTKFAFGGGFQSWINLFLRDGVYPFMDPVLRGFVLAHATGIALLAVFGELAIGIALLIGFWTKPASIAGAIYMLTLLFAADYPGANAPLWQFVGLSLRHSMLALCFVGFLVGDSEARCSLRSWLSKQQVALSFKENL